MASSLAWRNHAHQKLRLLLVSEDPVSRPGLSTIGEVFICRHLWYTDAFMDIKTCVKTVMESLTSS